MLGNDWRVQVRPGRDLKDFAEQLADEMGLPMATMLRAIVRQHLHREQRSRCQNQSAETPNQSVETPPPVALNQSVETPQRHQTSPLSTPDLRSRSRSLSPTGRERDLSGAPADAGPGVQVRDLERALSPAECTRLGEVLARGKFNGKDLTPVQAGILGTARSCRRAIGKQVAVVNRFLALEKGPPPGAHTAPVVDAGAKCDRGAVGTVEGLSYFPGDALSARECGMPLVDWLSASEAQRDAARQRKAEADEYRDRVRAETAAREAEAEASRRRAEQELASERAKATGMSVDEWRALAPADQVKAWQEASS